MFLTPEEYLEIERKAEFRSEYYKGEMFAMAGAGQRHNLIVMNLSGTLHQQFLTRSCVVYPPDLRVRTKNRAYCYPDVTAVCGESRFDDDHRDTLLNPVLLIEVTSPSTEAYDRGLKFEQYRSIETLREYLLVASDRTRVDTTHGRMTGDGF